MAGGSAPVGATNRSGAWARPRPGPADKASGKFDPVAAPRVLGFGKNFTATAAEVS